MHLNGELEPLVLTELFSLLPCAGAADVEFDKPILTSWAMASKVLYCSKCVEESYQMNEKKKWYDEQDI